LLLPGLVFSGLRNAIPGCVGELLRLKELWLDNNALTGAVPENLCQCTQLKVPHRAQHVPRRAVGGTPSQHKPRQ
jgi:hypothetical protein